MSTTECPSCFELVAAEPPNYISTCGKIIHKICYDDMIRCDGATVCWCLDKNHAYTPVVVRGVCGACHKFPSYVNIDTFEMLCECSARSSIYLRTAAEFMAELPDIFKMAHYNAAEVLVAQKNFLNILVPLAATSDEHDDLRAAFKQIDIIEEGFAIFIPLPPEVGLEFHVSRAKHIKSLQAAKIEVGWPIDYLAYQHNLSLPDKYFERTTKRMLVKMMEDGVFWTNVAAYIHRAPEITISADLQKYEILNGVITQSWETQRQKNGNLLLGRGESMKRNDKPAVDISWVPLADPTTQIKEFNMSQVNIFDTATGYKIRDRDSSDQKTLFGCLASKFWAICGAD